MQSFARALFFAALVHACVAAPSNHTKSQEIKVAPLSGLDATVSNATATEADAATEKFAGLTSTVAAAEMPTPVEKTTEKLVTSDVLSTGTHAKEPTVVETTAVPTTSAAIKSRNEQLKSSSEEQSADKSKEPKAGAGATVEIHEPVNAHQKLSSLRESKDEPNESINSIDDKISDVAHSVKNSASDGASQVSNAAGNAAKSASDTAKNVADNMQNGSASIAHVGWALCSAAVLAALIFAIAL